MKWKNNNTKNMDIFCRSKARQESDLLKSFLKKAQDDVVVLLAEKRKLLDNVRNLQVSLHLAGIFFFIQEKETV